MTSEEITSFYSVTMGTNLSSSTSQDALLKPDGDHGVQSTTSIRTTLVPGKQIPRENLNNETLDLLEKAADSLGNKNRGVKYNHEGILAVADKLRTDPSKQGIAKHILDLLKLGLHNMYFQFNGDHYIQIVGTAMGTALAPNYANLFMDQPQL